MVKIFDLRQGIVVLRAMIGSNMPPRVSVSAAFLSMVQTDEGIAALRDTYQIDGLELIDDTFYDALRRLLQESELFLSDLVK